MTRPLRLDVAEGWYHVTARGIDRREIFTEDRERNHFLFLLGEMSERYQVRVHAYVLMANHYHLLLQTPQANASRALQWLNVSYSLWFNRKHKRVGPLFQGRFKSHLVEGEGAWLLQASIYLHLNPIRIRALGLGKQQKRLERKGWIEPDQAMLNQRLKTLREYPWSSYPAYADYRRGPEWLLKKALLQRAGGARKYRGYVESYVMQGGSPEGWGEVKASLALGSQAFVEKAKRLIKKVSRDHGQRRWLQGRVSFDDVIRQVEQEKKMPWRAFCDLHGDWGRDLVLYLARKRSGMTLCELGQAAGGVDYKSVSKAVKRFERKLESDKALRQITERCLNQMSKVET
jgi:putative transposase